MSEEFLHSLTTVLGAALIVLLGLILVIIGVVVWFYQTRLKGMAAKGQAFALNWLPPRVHLVAEGADSTTKWDRSNKRVEALLAIGFQEVGRFSASNWNWLKLVALTQPASGCCAVVYHVESLGTWSDVFFPSASGEWIAVSNVKKRLHFLHLPGDRKFHEPNKSEAELVELILKTREQAVAAAIDASNFTTQYEAAFARAADTRLFEPMEDYQIRQLLREVGAVTCDGEEDELTGKELEGIKTAIVGMINQQLASACVLDFIRQETLSASEWQRSRDRLLVVHDRTPLRELSKMKSCEAFVTKELKPLLSGRKSSSDSPRQAFRVLNATLSPRHRYFSLGSVEKPIQADIYRGPLEGTST